MLLGLIWQKMQKLSKQQQQAILLKSQADPVWWAENVLGIKTLTWQPHRDILMAFAKHDRIAIKSGHSLGKDFISGVVSLWFLYCFPESIVLTTAPTDRQVEKIIWGEISKMWHNSLYPLGGSLKTKEIKISDKWYALGFTTKETNQSVGKFQGFKGKSILIVATEAQAIESPIYEQMEGVLTAPISKQYLAGNPLKGDGDFFKAFQSGLYKTFSFSCYDSPNYIADKEVIPGMVGRAWVEDKEKRWGKNSPLFQGRVLGEFPMDSVNTLLSLFDAKESIDRENPAEGNKVLGIDVARFGEDSTVFTLVDGGKVLWQQQFYGKPTTETEGIAINYIKNNKPDFVVIDEGAMGAGVVDHIKEEARALIASIGHSFRVIPFNFGAKPKDDVQFADLGTETYFNVCNKITNKEVSLIDDDELCSQLSSRRYKFNSKSKMKLEEKSDHKKRGLPSPDKADSLIMAIHKSLEFKPDLTEVLSLNSRGKKLVSAGSNW